MHRGLAPLPEILALLKRYGAMVLIDDAHASGGMGENGRLPAEHFGIQGLGPFVMGRLSNGRGTTEGFVVGRRRPLQMLRPKARIDISKFSLRPEQALAIMAALHIGRREPGLGQRQLHRVRRRRTGLIETGLRVFSTDSDITAQVVSHVGKGLEMGKRLFAHALLVRVARWAAISKDSCLLMYPAGAVHRPGHGRRLPSVSGLGWGVPSDLDGPFAHALRSALRAPCLPAASSPQRGVEFRSTLAPRPPEQSVRS